VFIPQKVADRLKAYIRNNDIQPDQRVFPICYETARTMVKKAGEKVGIRLRPHDLRRHAATYASGIVQYYASLSQLKLGNSAQRPKYASSLDDHITR